MLRRDKTVKAFGVSVMSDAHGTMMITHLVIDPTSSAQVTLPLLTVRAARTVKVRRERKRNIEVTGIRIYAHTVPYDQ